MGKSPLPKPTHVGGFFASLFCPPAVLFLTCKKIPSYGLAKFLLPVISGVLWILFIFSAIARYVDKSIGFQGIEFTAFAGFVTLVVAVRYEVRALYNIEGGGCLDFLAAFCAYPQAVWQTYVQLVEVEVPKPSDKADAQLIGESQADKGAPGNAEQELWSRLAERDAQR